MWCTICTSRVKNGYKGAKKAIFVGDGCINSKKWLENVEQKV
jgi:hypothetical protein